MTTQQFRFFLEAAKCLNFTEAARRLFVAQPTLSKQIALLEEELSVKLFFRNNRTVELTPAGLLFRKEVEKMEHNLLCAIDRARHLEKGLDGHLSIGLLDIADPSLFVIPLIISFQKQYPNIEINMMILGFSEIRKLLAEGMLDVVFGKNFDLQGILNLSEIDIYSNTPSILMTSRHRLAMEENITISQLKEEYFIVLDQDETRSAVHTLVDLCGKEGFYPKISKYAINNATRILYVCLGYGVTLIDKEIILPPWADAVTVPLYANALGELGGINLELAWSQSCTNPTIKLFIKMAKEMLELQKEKK